jgi:hypothetical protein
MKTLIALIVSIAFAAPAFAAPTPLQDDDDKKVKKAKKAKKAVKKAAKKAKKDED